MKTSQYKKQILELLNQNHLLSISEINALIPEADYSTIFRNMETLLQEGLIKKVLISNKSVAYESTQDIHDHFICNDCGKVESVYISHDLINGRKIDEITVRGSCGDCDK
jgi:Fe2+ or Zn2+ uptake regulation protein